MNVKKIMFITLAMSGLATSAFSMGTLNHSNGWYAAGSTLTVTATPDPYYMVDRWEGVSGGEIVSATNVAFVVSGSRTVSAVFKAVVTDSGSVPHYWIATWTNSVNFEELASVDSDGDGFSNAEEYWAGTDPLSDESYLQISRIVMDGGNLRLEWSHAPNVDSNIPPLLVQSCTSLTTQDWQTEPDGPLSVTDGVNSWDTGLGTPKFFRLKVPDRP